MNNANKKITATIEIQALIAEAQDSLNSFKHSMDEMWQHSAPPKGLSKKYEELQNRLESLNLLTQDGIIDSTGLKDAKRDYNAIAKEIRSLSVEFSLLSDEQKKAMLSTQERAELNARTAAVKKYTEALEKNRQKQVEIDKIKEDKSVKEASKNTKENDRKTLQTRLDSVAPPKVPKEAEGYIKNQERLLEVQEKIKKNENYLAELRIKGKKDTNTYKASADNLESLKKEQETLLKGEEAYNKYAKAMKNYEEWAAPLKSQIAALDSEIEALNGEINNFDKEISKIEKTQSSATLEDLKKQLKELGVEGLESAESLEEIEEVLNKLEKQALSGVEAELDKASESLNQMKEAAERAKEGLDEATDSIREQENLVSKTEAFAEKIKQFVGLAGAAQVMSKALRSSFEATKELDAVMTEMAVVTDLKVGDFWEQLPEHTERASELGVAIKDVYEAETLYYQQGLKSAEVTAMSTETLKMARIAGLSAADATDKMTAALRGFNMELNETSAQRVADVYSELAAITAADVNEISTAMSKTASIASSAGMEFETTAAFLSQIIETTRESAETAGTALKTVIARFQELKKDPSEIGEVDGEIVDANQIETALRSVGVSLRDANGQFRELDEVFLELSSKWDSLDTNTQRYIATIAAGSRQQSRFIAMMSDYSRTQELVNAANTSAGAANAQYEKTLDSLQSKLEKLKNAWTSFTQGIADSKLIKAGVDLLTQLLTAINKITDSFGEFSGAAKIALLVAALYLGDKAVKVFMNSLTQTKSVFSSLGAVFTQTGGVIKADIENLTAKMREFGNNASVAKDILVKTFGPEVDAAIKEYRLSVVELTKAEKELAKAQKNADTTGEQLTELKNRQAAATQRVKKAETSLNQTMKFTAQEQKLYSIAVGSGIAADEAAILVSNKKVLAILREKGAIDELNNVIDENTAKETLNTFAKSANGASSLSKSLTDLGDKLKNFDFKASFQGLGNGLKSFGSGVVNVVKQIGQFIASCWGLIVVIAVLVVAIVGLVHYIKYLEKTSPEGKLKTAQEAADRAAQAADRAAEAYQDLSNSLESLDDKYKGLESLTKGSKEWKKAVHEINKEVLDLIDKHPQLAAFYESVDGVLRVKEGKEDDIEQVLNQASLESAAAQAMELQAKAEVTKAQNNVNYDKLSNAAKYGAQSLQDAVLWGGVTAGAAAGGGLGAWGGAALGANFGGIGAAPGAVIGGIAGGLAGGILGGIGAHAGISALQSDGKKSDQEYTEQIAKAMASGEFNPYDEKEFSEYLESTFHIDSSAADLWASELSKATDELIEFGEGLNQADESIKLYNDAQALAALNGMNLAKYSAEEQAWIEQAATGEAYATALETAQTTAEQMMSDKESAAKAKEAVAKNMYGADATVDGNKITYKEGDETKTVELTDEEFKSNYAAMVATETLTDTLETFPQIVKHMSSELDKTNPGAGDAIKQMNADPEQMTKDQVEQLSRVSTSTWEHLYNSMTSEQQAYYGSLEKFMEAQRKTLEDQERKFKDADETMSKYGMSIDKVSDKMTGTNAQKYAKSLQQFDNTLASNVADMKELNDSIVSIGDNLTDDQFNSFISLWSSFDKSNLNEWENFEKALEEAGLSTVLLSDAYANLKNQAQDLAHAIEWVDFSKLSENLGKQYETISKQQDSNSRKVDKETYEALVQIDSTLSSSFVQLGEDFIYLGKSVYDLTNTLKQQYIQQLKAAEKQLLNQYIIAKTINDMETGENMYEKVELTLQEYAASQGKSVMLQASQEEQLMKMMLVDRLVNNPQALAQYYYGAFEIPDSKNPFANFEEFQKLVNDYNAGIESGSTDFYKYNLRDRTSSDVNISDNNYLQWKREDKEKVIYDFLGRFQQDDRNLDPKAPDPLTNALVIGFNNLAEQTYNKIQEDLANIDWSSMPGYDQLMATEQQAQIGEEIVGAIESTEETVKTIEAPSTVNEEIEKSLADVNPEVLSYFRDDNGNQLLNVGTDLSDLSDDEIDLILQQMKKMGDDFEKYAEDIEEQIRQNRIALYTLDSAEKNKQIIDSTDINTARGLEEFLNRSKALETKWVEAGMANNQVVGRMTEILDKIRDGTATEDEKAELKAIQQDVTEHLIIAEKEQKGAANIAALESRALDALVKQQEKEIEKLTEVNDSINDANQALLNKIQQQINENRQQRDNEKTEQSIADEQSRLTYLMADSSGSSMIEAMALQQSISEAQQSYQDQLIDQSLQKLSDDNARAAEQRERQIAVLEAQLAYNQESGVLARRAESLVLASLSAISSGVDPLETDLAQLIMTEESWGSASAAELVSLQNEFIVSAASASNSMNDIYNSVEEGSDDLEEEVENLPSELDTETMNTTVGGIKAILEEEYGTFVTDKNTKKVSVSNNGKAGKRSAAVQALVNHANSKTTGLSGLKNDEVYAREKKNYMDAGGTEAEFYEEVTAGTKTFDTGRLSDFKVSGGYHAYPNGEYDEGMTFTIGGQSFTKMEAYDPGKNFWGKQKNYEDAKGTTAEVSRAITQATYPSGTTPSAGDLALYQGVAYMYRGTRSRWSPVLNDDGSVAIAVAEAMKKKLNAFETGGLADFTGPAWLDGTKSHPELVLNARDTQNFIQLKNILGEILDGNHHTKIDEKNNTSAVNSFDIDITVESIGDDYDVEQLATKIRSMLYDDASYRNVNNVSFRR